MAEGTVSCVGVCSLSHYLLPDRKMTVFNQQSVKTLLIRMYLYPCCHFLQKKTFPWRRPPTEKKGRAILPRRVALLVNIPFSPCADRFPCWSFFSFQVFSILFVSPTLARSLSLCVETRDGTKWHLFLVTIEDWQGCFEVTRVANTKTPAEQPYVCPSKPPVWPENSPPSDQWLRRPHFSPPNF